MITRVKTRRAYASTLAALSRSDAAGGLSVSAYARQRHRSFEVNEERSSLHGRQGDNSTRAIAHLTAVP